MNCINLFIGASAYSTSIARAQVHLIACSYIGYHPLAILGRESPDVSPCILTAFRESGATLHLRTIVVEVVLSVALVDTRNDIIRIGLNISLYLLTLGGSKMLRGKYFCFGKKTARSKKH